MSSTVVCYCASDGYLLQTFVSAVQARSQAEASVRIVVIRIGDGPSAEGEAFRRACDAAGIEFLDRSRAVLSGLAFYYARLFLDELVPGEYERILYLDGDTQVVSSLMPLVHAVPPAGGLLAVRDPMVLYSEASATFDRYVQARWDASMIPAVVRPRYVNSGVVMLRRGDAAEIRRQALAARAERGRDTAYPEQDLLNVVLSDRIETISPEWNFPGFLLGTRIHRVLRPRIIHFMSDPRPWRASYGGWGPFHQAYEDAVVTEPTLAPYLLRAGSRERARYRLQLAYKSVKETRHWQRPGAADHGWVRDADRRI